MILNQQEQSSSGVGENRGLSYKYVVTKTDRDRLLPRVLARRVDFTTYTLPKVNRLGDRLVPRAGFL